MGGRRSWIALSLAHRVALAILLACIAASLAALLAVSSAAQTPSADPTRPVAAAPSASAQVVVISMETVRSQAQAARSVAAQAAQIRGAIEAELEARQQALSAEEQALVALRQELARDRGGEEASAQFEARAARFEREVRLLKRDRRRIATALRDAVRIALKRLDDVLQPILWEIMEEANAVIMIDEREVVANAKSLDVTGLAIKRLDAALPSLEVQWPPSETVE